MLHNVQRELNDMYMYIRMYMYLIRIIVPHDKQRSMLNNVYVTIAKSPCRYYYITLYMLCTPVLTDATVTSALHTTYM